MKFGINFVCDFTYTNNRDLTLDWANSLNDLRNMLFTKFEIPAIKQRILHPVGEREIGDPGDEILQNIGVMCHDDILIVEHVGDVISAYVKITILYVTYMLTCF